MILLQINVKIHSQTLTKGSSLSQNNLKKKQIDYRIKTHVADN